jgi:hypothetical protein
MKYLLPVILLICSCSKEADKPQKLSSEYEYACNKNYKIVEVSQDYQYKVITISKVAYNLYTIAKDEANFIAIHSGQHLVFPQKHIIIEAYSVDIFEEAMKKQGFSDNCDMFSIKARLSDLEVVVYKKSK